MANQNHLSNEFMPLYTFFDTDTIINNIFIALTFVETTLSCLSPTHIFVKAEGREPRTWNTY